MIQESLKILQTAAKGKIDTGLETLYENPDKELMNDKTVSSEYKD